MEVKMCLLDIRIGEEGRSTGARGTDLPPPFFSNFLFTNVFSIKCLYFFILFHLFFLILTCSCQYWYNRSEHANHYTPTILNILFFLLLWQSKLPLMAPFQCDYFAYWYIVCYLGYDDESSWSIAHLTLNNPTINIRIAFQILNGYDCFTILSLFLFTLSCK
jgi:hypothetical protein